MNWSNKMVTTGSHNKPLTYAIIHGLFGRQAQNRKLGRLLDTQGFSPAKNARIADIIIAHSAGCWLIPENANARLVIWDGAPLAEDRGLAWRQANLLIHKHSSIGRSIKHLSHNAYYGLRHIRRNVRIIRMAKKAKPIILPGTSYVFIANRYDPWPYSRHLNEFLETKNWTFINMPGTHDEIWRHPEHYVSIINHYAELLD